MKHKRKTRRAPPAAASSVPAAKKRVRITDLMLARARAMLRRAYRERNRVNPFALPEFPPQVVPRERDHQLAYDDDILANTNWAGGIFENTFGDGLQFLGYPVLSELAQRPEYRMVSERLATEMTRKWVKFVAVNQDDDKSERIKELDDAFRHFQVKERFRANAEQDGFFGRSHLFVDLKGSRRAPRDELATSIGNGLTAASRAKIKRGSLQRLTTVEPLWAYPRNYVSNDPLDPAWYNPDMWQVFSRPVHSSRLLRFVGREVPDILKPAYAFGGLAMSQMIKPYVDKWLRVVNSVADIVDNFSTSGIKTDMEQQVSGVLDDAQGADFFKRIELYNEIRRNSGLWTLDKNTEEFFQFNVPLGTLDILQAQAQEHIASVSHMPLIILLGIQPAGLNASSEGEIRAFYDWIAAYQDKFFAHNLRRVMHIVMLHLWGEVDKGIDFKFEPLWSLDSKALADQRKTEQDTDMGYVNGNVLSAEEVRKKIASDPDSPYKGINPDEVPEPTQEEGAELEPGEEGAEPAHDSGGQGAVPFGPAASDSTEFKEGDHPRGQPGNSGQFAKGGGSGAASTKIDKPKEKAQSIVSRIKSHPFLGKHARTEADYGNSLFDEKPDGSIVIGMRDVGHWENPPDAREEEDYDWQVPTKETSDAVKKLVADLETQLGVKISVSGGEKNWTYFHVKPQPKPTATASAASNIGEPIDASKMRQVGKQMGSNPGGVYENAEGQRFYIKKGKSAEHTKQEYIAAALYGLAGSPTLKYRPAGANHIATEMSKLDKKRVQDLTPEERKKAQEDFVTHAWTSNWDAVGLDGDNIGTVKGVPTSLDLGGALEYRAQGAPKGQAFGDKVGELNTLRDKKINPIAAQTYGSMTDADMRASAQKVTKIKDSAVRDTVKKFGGSDALATKLIARKHDIAQRFGIATDEGQFNESDHPRGKPGNAGQFAPKGSGGGGGLAKFLEEAWEQFKDDNEIEEGSEEEDVFKFQVEAEATEVYHKEHPDEFGKAVAAVHPDKKAKHSTQVPFVDLRTKLKENIAAGNVSSPETQSLARQLVHGYVLKVQELLKVKKNEAAEAAKGKAKKYGKHLPQKEKNELHNTLKDLSAAVQVLEATKAPASESKYPAAVQNVIAQYQTVAPATGKATPQELEKAKKGTPINHGILGTPSTPETNALIESFNKEYEGKTLSDPATLEKKVAAFKELKQKADQVTSKYQAEQAAKQAEANKAAAAALAKAKEASKAKNAEYMRALGISEVEASAFEALVEMHGGFGGDVVEKFKAYQKKAETLGYPISGFQYALIQDYIDGGYGHVNKALRSESWSPKTHVYAKLVNNAIDKMPKYTGEVKRGTHLDPEALAKYKPGHVVREHAFTSTGIGFKFNGNVSYSIKSIGKNGADFSGGANKGEKEVLFKAGTYFIVHKVTKKGGTTHIEMEEIEGYA